MTAPAHLSTPMPSSPSTQQAQLVAVSAQTRPGRKVDPTYYWMIIPVLILFALFSTVPAIIGGFFSFTNYAGYGDWKMIGLQNFQNIFSDPEILASYLFTFFFAIVATLTVNVVALLLALGLNAKIKFKTGIRGIYFIPMVLSGLIVAYVFNYLFSTTLPTLAETFGISPLATSILANEHWAWVAIVFVTVWQGAPGATIIYLAGLQSISPDVTEAAAPARQPSPWPCAFFPVLLAGITPTKWQMPSSSSSLRSSFRCCSFKFCAAERFHFNVNSTDRPTS